MPEGQSFGEGLAFERKRLPFGGVCGILWLKTFSTKRMENKSQTGPGTENKGFTLIGPISWQEIFDSWRTDESTQESWKKHWEESGFGSWDEWRMHHMRPYRPETLSWSLYHINNPRGTVPGFFGAPSRNWIENAYDGATTKRLRDIIHLPIISENAKIDAVRDRFPEKTMLIGVRVGDDIILIEGMHRSCAIATWDPSILFTSEVTIALATWPESEFVLKR